MTIRMRLFLCLISLAVAIGALAVGGQYAMRTLNEAIITIYNDRVVPLRDLKAVADAYAVSIVDLTHKARAGTLAPQQALAEVKKARSLIREKLAAYAATELTPKEKQLFDRTRELLKPADAATDKLEGLLGAADKDGIAAFAEKELYPAIDPVSEAISALVDLQIEVASQEFQSSEATYDVIFKIMLALTAFGGFVVVVSLWIVAAKVSTPLTRMRDAMDRLAAGELDVAIPSVGVRDEVGAMAQSMQVFKESAIAKRNAEEELAAQQKERERLRAEREAREKQAADEVADLCGKIAAGDLASRLEEAGKEGFLLSLSRLLNELAGTLESMTGELDGVMAAMSKGDLTKQVNGQYAGVFGRLKASVNGTNAKLAEFAARLSETTTQVHTASAEISTGSQDLAGRTESQAASIEETAASMHEITTTVKQNADNAQAANQLAVAARDTANTGGRVVSEAVTAMGRIEESARKISDIVALIDEIAFQTNLLALNASVEAARAGEAGKGFAVVAQEVRALAQRSASASKDIKALIQESNAQVKTGAGLVNQAGQSLTEIVASIKKVSDIVAEIAAASREQATGLDQINTAVGSMDETTQRNAALVEETTAAAQSLDNQAKQLAELVRFFKI